MKPIPSLIAIAIAGFLGYLLEPSLRSSLVGTSHASNKPPSAEPSPQPLAFDYSSITPDQLPETVTLLTEVGYSDEDIGIRVTLKPGAKAKLIRLVENTAVIQIANTEYITSLPASQTDLSRQLLARTPTSPTGTQPQPPADTPPSEPTSPTDSAPTDSTPTDSTPPPPAPPSEAPPTPPAPPTIPDLSGPDPEPPAEDPSPTPPATDAAAPTDILAIMRNSIQSAEIKEFTISQVKSWQPEPQETIDGTTYQVGSLTYEKTSLFGTNIVAAKAYILDGKVQRWVWPKSGLTIE